MNLAAFCEHKRRNSVYSQDAVFCCYEVILGDTTNSIYEICRRLQQLIDDLSDKQSEEHTRQDKYLAIAVSELEKVMGFLQLFVR
jgi:hypothetical protein